MSVLRTVGYKDKDLLGIPWRVVFALQGFSVVPGGMVSAAAQILKGAREDRDWQAAARVELMLKAWTEASLVTGAYWHRSDIVWSKTNATPERVPDRPVRGHEFIFLLAKSARYFFDIHGVLEKAVGRDRRRPTTMPGYRRMRSVWQIAKSCYPGSHVAPFPTKLVEPCIRAGTSDKGCCPVCGAPWRRQKGWKTWLPGCRCGKRLAPVPCVVLDPFAGSGTTGVVALRLGRAFLGFDLAGGDVEQGGWTPHDRLRAAARGKPEPFVR